MFTPLDSVLFPDECVIVKSDNTFIFPIFKNGSSSLTSDFPKIPHKDVANVTEVTVFIREPIDRFVSGVTTYIKKNPHIPESAITEFVKQFLFFNRHFCPQFYWLVNLRRHSDATIKLENISRISEYTNLHKNHSEIKTPSVIADNPTLHFYMALDKVLYWELIGQTVTFADIVLAIKDMYPDVYKEVIERSKQICSVLD